MFLLWAVVGLGLLQCTTATACGCDICNVETEIPWFDDITFSNWTSASWKVVETSDGSFRDITSEDVNSEEVSLEALSLKDEEGETGETVVCRSPQLGKSTVTNTSCCIDRWKSYEVHFQPAGFWEKAGSIRIDGDTVAGNAMQKTPTQFPRASPFKLISGHECDIAGTCIFSSRRRVGTEFGVDQGGECEVEVDNRTGPFLKINAALFRESEFVTVNGVRYDMSKKVPPTTVRPHGNLKVEKRRNLTPEKYRKKSSWAICTPPLQTFEDYNYSAAVPTLSPARTMPHVEAARTRVHYEKVHLKLTGTCQSFPKTVQVCVDAAKLLGYGNEDPYYPDISVDSVSPQTFSTCQKVGGYLEFGTGYGPTPYHPYGGYDSTPHPYGGTPAPTPPPGPPADTCHYANDGYCDEPPVCSYGTDCTDCGNCGGGYQSVGSGQQPPGGGYQPPGGSVGIGQQPGQGGFPYDDGGYGPYGERSYSYGGYGMCTSWAPCFCMDPNDQEDSVVVYTTTEVAGTDYSAKLSQPEKPKLDPSQPIHVTSCMVNSKHHCRGKQRKYPMSTVVLPVLGPLSSPYPVDWDGDGDMDLLIGRQTGELVYLENTDGIFDISNAVGIPKVADGATCLRYWYSDVENIECNSWCCFKKAVGEICLTEDGSFAQCEQASAWGISLGASLHPVPVDWDGDGDLDVVAGSCDGHVYLFRNTSGLGGLFEQSFDTDDPFSGIDHVNDGCVHPELADWDADGDYDLLLGLESGVVEYYENIGGDLRLQTGDTNPFRFVRTSLKAVPLAIDMDGDGDLDLLVGNGATEFESGQVKYYERNAHGVLILHSDAFPSISTMADLIPRAADLNGDGYPDLLIFNGDNSELDIYWSQIDNDLHEHFGPENPFGGLIVEARAVSQAVDWDGDGHPEFIVGGTTGELTQYAARKDFTVTASVPSTLQSPPRKPYVAQQVVDWDHDGDQDLLVGGQGGDVLFYERLPDGSLADQSVEVVPPNPNHWVSPHAVDWDGDGLLDLLLGDSGTMAARIITLAEFDTSEWNTAFTEMLDPEKLIADQPVFITGSPSWVLAWCGRLGYWFIFRNDTDATWLKNRAGKCVGAVAKTEQAFLGKANAWKVTDPEIIPNSTDRHLVISDGSDDRPHCDPCTNRGALAECGSCTLSDAMVQTCVDELCKASKLFKGTFLARHAVPANACACQDHEGFDVYGATCKQYNRKWCGRYDHPDFISGQQCCVCGGGIPRNVSLLRNFSLQANCSVEEWFDTTGRIESITAPSDTASVRYFKRSDTGPTSLTEVPKTSDSNPFWNISASTRPYPFAVDWNKDGKLDLVLGSFDRHITDAQVPSCSEECSTGAKTPITAVLHQCADELCKNAGYTRGFAFCIDAPTAHVQARCKAEGGTIRYFEQGSGLSLTEQLGEANPFAVIDYNYTAIPSIIDWDSDGALEVIVSDDSHHLHYFRQGQSCTMNPPCNRHGLCHPVLGTCSCISGTTLNDCSRCDASFVTEPSSSATANDCRACPGVGTPSGTCSRRGICVDDRRARETSGASNSTLAFQAGNGTCFCSPHFTGDDCRGGSCPPGMEYVEGNPDKCRSCRKGTIKPSSGDVPCVICPEGKFAEEAGATSCDICPAGKYQGEPGSAKCYPCDAGSASAAGSAVCISCGPGKYAYEAGLGSCSPCAPGSWTGDSGSHECAECAAGEYSSGTHACRQCPSGSFSDTMGQENCTLCEAGTYSSTQGGDNKEVCIPCSVGKYGSEPGQPQESSCKPCATGATTLRAGSTSADLCIQPDPADYECIAGHDCSISVTGNMLLKETHRVAISLYNGDHHFTDVSTNGHDYEWSLPPIQGGNFKLKWCAGVHQQCEFDLGMLTVRGPSGWIEVDCVRGRTCVSSDPLYEVGLAGLQSSFVVMSKCGGPVITLGRRRFQIWPVRSWVLDGGDPTVGFTTVGFGNDVVTADPSTGYQLCWCALGPRRYCQDEWEFDTLMGELDVEGPYSGQEKQCSLGQDCALEGITGYSVNHGDRIMVMDSCEPGGQAIPGVPNGGIAEFGAESKRTTSGDTFDFAGDKVLRSFPGIYRLCFCRPLAGTYAREGIPDTSCSVPADFRAPVGLFTANGPYPEQNVGCFLGASCTLAGVGGIGLVDTDEVLIQETCGQNGSQVPVGLPMAATVATDEGSNFALGMLTDAKTGQYSICWKPGNGRSFGRKIGTLFVSCPPGKYGFEMGCEVCPLGHYCTGGTAFANYKDDLKFRCPDAGSTTELNGSTSVDDCKCRPGYRKAANCVVCAAGRYKAAISNDAECPGQCPNGTTSRPGAESAALCYSTAVLHGQRLDEAKVFVLGGKLTVKIPACGHRSAQRELLRSIAAQLGLDESRVEVTVTPPKSCASPAAGSRRLQAAQPAVASEVTYRIVQGSEDKIERLRQRLNFNEMQTDLPKNMLIESGQNAFVITTEKLTCPEHMAFPLGTSVDSLEQCTCSLGYFQGKSGICEACAVGSYKGDVGDQACSLCQHQMVDGRDVALTTLEKAATVAGNCTCPPGYFAKAPSTECMPCPKGSYCTGGEQILPCPPGSTTLSTRTGNVMGCVCDKGQTQTVVRNATQRCQPCPAQFYKDAIGDVECSQSCPQYSTSNPGATDRTDCYCLAGFFSDPTIGGTCQLCPSDGVHCAGNFTPADSHNHTEPASKDGYYLTGFSTAEECIVKLESGASACLQGATFSNQTGACAGLQTGVLCGACQHLTARNLGDEPCVQCDEKLTDVMLIATIVADVFMKAGFGMFLGKQAMSDGMEAAKTDSVILRILLQWITAMSVLQTTNLNSLKLYDWSKEELLKENAAEAAEKLEKHGGHASSFTSATGLSFQFEFPEEFEPIFDRLMSVKGSIPSPQSPQQSLECLVQRHLTPTDMPTKIQLIVPALFWLTYPCFVLVAAYVLCLIFVKCVWPILLWFAARAKKKLRKLLLKLGASEASADAALARMNQDAAMELLEDPSAFTTVEGLKQHLGEDVCHEVAANAFAKIMRVRLHEKIDEVICREDVEEERRNALTAVRDDGEEGLRRLLAKLLGIMDASVFKGSVLSMKKDAQEAVAGAIERFIEEMEAAELAALVRGRGVREANGAAVSDAAEDAPAVNTEEAEQEEQEEYGILGVFRERGSCYSILVDAWPLMLVTLYSVWDTITRRFLGLIQVKRILIEEPSATVASLNVPKIQGRWLYDTRFQIFRGDHFWVGIIGVLGLCIWSIGFLAVIFRKLRKNKHQLQDQAVLRTYGYFYNGLEPSAYWWDVVAKKFDILCLYFVTFADLFHDPKAKLIMYLGFAGIFWAAHNVYHPFDNRHNNLADRIEAHGLTVRFVTLFLLQCLLLMSADIVYNAIAASFILLIIISFLATTIFVLFIEMTAAQATGDDDDDAGEEVQEKFEEKANGAGKKLSKMIAGKSKDPLRQAFAKVFSVVFGLFVGKLFELIMKAAAFVTSVRDSVDREVPSIVWQGPNSNYLLMEPKRDRRSCPRRLLAVPLRFVYRLEKEEQWGYMAETLGNFLVHFMTLSGCRELPPRFLDIVLTLPGALAIEQAAEDTDKLHVRTAQRVRQTVGSSEKAAQTSSAEELVKALFWLQHLSREQAQEFLFLASQTDPDFEPSPAPAATSSATRLGVTSV